MEITDTGTNGLDLNGEGCEYVGLQLSATTTSVIRVRNNASDTIIRELRLTGCVARGIQIEGANVRVENSRFECVGAAGNDNAAVYLRNNAQDVVLVGNYFGGHTEDSVEIDDLVSGIVIDHNTFVGPRDNAIRADGILVDACIRNNIFVDLDFALLSVHVPDFGNAINWAPNCGDALPDGTWNNVLFNVAHDCQGCSVPTGTDLQRVFEFSGFWSVDPGIDAYGCITSPNLIDAAADLGYDRNGVASGDFEGALPDVGAFEASVGPCPPR
jgi:hypothetical protein